MLSRAMPTNGLCSTSVRPESFWRSSGSPEGLKVAARRLDLAHRAGRPTGSREISHEDHLHYKVSKLAMKMGPGSWPAGRRPSPFWRSGAGASSRRSQHGDATHVNLGGVDHGTVCTQVHPSKVFGLIGRMRCGVTTRLLSNCSMVRRSTFAPSITTADRFSLGGLAAADGDCGPARGSIQGTASANRWWAGVGHGRVVAFVGRYFDIGVVEAVRPPVLPGEVSK